MVKVSDSQGIDVSIVIVNYNTVDLVIDCISSIIDKTNGISYEIIVVDNASSDDCKNKLDKLFKDKIRVIESDKNLGFGKANNLGINISVGRNIFFLNPDTILINNAIKILSDFLDSNDSLGGCGGNLFDDQGNPIHSHNVVFPSIFDEIDQTCRRTLSHLFYGKSTLFNYGNFPIEVAYITGADLMIKKSIINKIGAFNPEFFMYYEETDLQKRISNYGYKIFNNPSAQIVHLEGKSIKTSRVRETMSLTSRKSYFRLHYSRLYCLFSDLLYESMIRSGLLASYVLRNKILREKMTQRLELFKEIYRK